MSRKLVTSAKPAAETTRLLDVRNLKTHFLTARGRVHAVDGVTISLERGKTLVVRLLTLGEADEEGQVKVFFELNGQQRIIKVPNRKLAAKVVGRRKADEGNDAHVAAPMPGLVVTVAVKAGQEIKAGDVIVTLEAMKMEMALHAPRDGVVKEILVSSGRAMGKCRMVNPKGCTARCA